MLRLIRCTSLALLTCTLGVPATVAAQAFEGRVTVEMAGPGGGAMPMVILAKDGKSRMEAVAGGMPVAMIMDYRAGNITTLMTSQKMYMKMDLKQMEQQMRAMGGAPGTAEAPKYTRTGRRETIAGQSCEHVLFDNKDGKQMDICAAQGLGFFGGAGGGMGGGRGGAGIPGGLDQLMKDFKDGFFPLRMEMVEGTTRRQVLLVTKIERQPVEASLFTVPAGYTEMQMPPGMPGRP